MKKSLFFCLLFSVLMIVPGGLAAQKHYRPKHTKPKVHSIKKKRLSGNDLRDIQKRISVSRDNISGPVLVKSRLTHSPLPVVRKACCEVLQSNEFPRHSTLSLS